MNSRAVVALCLSVLAFTPARAQQQGMPDPVSGHWGADGVTFLRLKYDGKGTVTGQVVAGSPTNLANISTGTFDPRTGALRLEGDAKHPDTGAIVHFILEATVDRELLRASGTFGTETLSPKTLLRVPVETGAAVDTVSTVLRFGFTEVSDWITRSAALVPAEKYTVKPAPTVRTFGELVAHVVDGYNAYCGAAAPGKRVQWSDATEKGKTDKATVALKLKQATDACAAAYGGKGQLQPLMANIAHSNLHYGNIIVYVRMLGLVPPSS